MGKLEDQKKITLYKEFEKHDKGVDDGKRMMSNGIILLAHHLKAIKDNKLYLAQGDNGQNSFKAYVVSKGINYNTANKYIALYTFYIEEMGKPVELIGEMSTDKLLRFQPALAKIKDPKEREEMFEKMNSDLSGSDLRKEFEEKKLIPKSSFRIDHCEDCNGVIIYYNQDDICKCKGVHAVYAMPVEQK